MERYQFSAREYVNMVLLYAECNYDGARALRTYAERYPNAHVPRNSRVILSALDRIRNNEPIVPRQSGGPRPVITVRQEENVIRHFEEEPGSSTRRAGRLYNMSHGSVFKILKKNKEDTRKEKLSKRHAAASKASNKRSRNDSSDEDDDASGDSESEEENKPAPKKSKKKK